MWIIISFDLPMTTPNERKEYNRFRKYILRSGFNSLQRSVYARSCSNKNRADTFISHLKNNIPKKGNIMIITMTQASFEKQFFYLDSKLKNPPEPPPQFLIFED